MKFIFKKDVTVLLETTIKRRNGDDAGDIDLALLFNRTVELTSVLPAKCEFRPPITDIASSAKHYLPRGEKY